MIGSITVFIAISVAMAFYAWEQTKEIKKLRMHLETLSDQLRELLLKKNEEAKDRYDNDK